jgi:hypothetical protein
MIDYLEQGHAINGIYNAVELRRLRQEIARKRRGKLTQNMINKINKERRRSIKRNPHQTQQQEGALLLHDNSPVHPLQVAISAYLPTALKFFSIPHILRTCPPLTSTCF